MKKTDKVAIIYHKEDNDGLFSMAIIYNYLTNEVSIPTDNIELVPCDYEDMTRISTVKCDGNDTELDILLNCNDVIFMTDISFSDINLIKKMYDTKKNKFIWIDHHAPIINESLKNNLGMINGIRDTKRSAILNAYHYLYDTQDKKYTSRSKDIEFFRILSAWDSFTFEQEGMNNDYAKNVNTGVTNHYMLNEQEIIDVVHNILYVMKADDVQSQLISKFYTEGTTYNNIRKAHIDKMVADYGTPFTIKDGNNVRTAIAIFVQEGTNSQMFDSVKELYQSAIVFKHMKNDKWTLSVYNTNESDTWHCGDFCKKKYNGGGHVGAAGCQISEAQFIKCLTSKTI